MIIPGNSCLAAPKIYLAKLTDRPAASSRLSTFNVNVRCSSQVTLTIRMSSSQLATSSSGSLGVCRMIRVNADGSTVTAVRRHRERPFCVCLFSAILTWWYPNAKSICVKHLFSPSKMVCMPPIPPLSATSCALRARQSMHNRRVPFSFFHNSIVPPKASLMVGL